MTREERRNRFEPDTATPAGTHQEKSAEGNAESKASPLDSISRWQLLRRSATRLCASAGRPPSRSATLGLRLATRSEIEESRPTQLGESKDHGNHSDASHVDRSHAWRVALVGGRRTSDRPTTQEERDSSTTTSSSAEEEQRGRRRGTSERARAEAETTSGQTSIVDSPGRGLPRTAEHTVGARLTGKNGQIRTRHVQEESTINGINKKELH